MANIVLGIVGDTTDVYKKIADLQKYTSALKPIKLKFETSGLNNVSKNALALAKAQAQIELSANKAAEAERKAAAASLAYGKQAEATRTQEARRRAEIEAGATALKKKELQEEKTRTATKNYETATVKAEAAEKKRQAATDQSRQKLKDMEAQQEKTSASALRFGNAFTSLFSRIASTLTRRLINEAFTAIRTNIRDTLNVMKEVDTELINIQKVSGKSSADIAAIGERAYETAAKYGVAVQDYLSAVYSFQKAGLGESAEQMAELATKTMLVGDTTAAVAEKFLISSNAAWELHGNIEELNKVIDQADYINNNYATTLDKIAAGLPIVASVASNAGMTYSETMAALGTIQSITQESGTKSATALRALILNIEKEAGTYLTEEGEEFEVTEESIKGLQGLLEKYAKTEMDAAKASGELINPLTAIKALFEGMRNGDVNDIELFQLLSAMGGKLRTNQLTALVKNFDMLDQMLVELGGSAGTADKEVSLMLESWEKKTQILKDRWQKFIAELVSTDDIKGLIDDITTMVENLDPQKFGAALQDFFRPIIEFVKNADWRSVGQTISDTIGKVEKLAKGGVILAIVNPIIRLITTISGGTLISSLSKAAKYASAFVKALMVDPKTMLALYGPTGGLVLGFAAILTGVVLLGKALDEQGQKIKVYEELDKKVKDLQHDLDTLYGSGSEYDKLISKGNDLTDVEKSRLKILEAQKQALEEEIRLTKIAAYSAWNEAYGTGASAPVFEYDANGVRTGSRQGTKDEYDIAEIRHSIQLAREEYGAAAISADEYRSKLLGVISAYKDTYNTLVEMRDAGMSLSDSQEALIEYYERLAVAASASDEQIKKVQNGPTAATTENSSIRQFWAFDPEKEAEKWAAYTGAVAEAAAEAEAELNATLGNMGNDLNDWGVSQSAIDEMSAAFSNLATTANKETAPAVENVSEKLGEIPEDKDITLTPHFENALSAIQRYVHFLDYLKENYSSTLTSTITHDDREHGKFTQETFSGANGIPARAVGDSNFPGGKTLVNELGPELISENGRAYIAGGGKPTVVNLSRGAIVIPADQTREAIKGGMPKYGRARVDVLSQSNWGGEHLLAVDSTPAAYTPPKPKTNWKGGTTKSSSGSPKSTTITFNFKDLESKLSEALKLYDAQAKLAENEGDYAKMAEMYEKSQEAIKDLVDKYRQAGYADDSIEIVTLLNKNYDYAKKQLDLYEDKWDDLISALEADTDATKALKELEEKRTALEEAVTAYENAQKQRTVRMYNAATGQWEWIADDKQIQSAKEKVTSAEETYNDAVKKQAIEELKKMKESVTDLSDVVLGPALSAVVTMSETSDEFQNFARALDAVFGVGSFLQYTEGTTKALSTVDSHDTNYSFGGVSLTEEQAASMTLKELAQMLQVLKLT